MAGDCRITGGRKRHPRLPAHIAVELLPESENRFFERLSGMPLAFSRDAQGKVNGLTVHYEEKTISYLKISDKPPKAPAAPPRPRVAIKLDTKHVDATIGHYEFAPSAAFPTGANMTIWREADQLVAQASGHPPGCFRHLSRIRNEFLSQDQRRGINIHQGITKDKPPQSFTIPIERGFRIAREGN